MKHTTLRRLVCIAPIFLTAAVGNAQTEQDTEKDRQISPLQRLDAIRIKPGLLDRIKLTNANPNPNAPAAGFFTPTRARLVVFIHGMTEAPNGQPASASDNTSKPGIPDSLVFSRYYWGFRFVRAMLGGRSGPLRTGSGRHVTENDWQTSAVADSSPAAHFVEATDPSRPGMIGLMLHRPAHVDLMAQVKSAVEQLHTLYTGRFPSASEPQIILVAHSMGGLVSRAILANPALPVSCGPSRSPSTLDAVTRTKADFIRNRTTCLITLATPHQGSPVANMVRDRRFVPWLQGELQRMSTFFPVINVGIRVGAPEIKKMVDSMGQRPAVADLETGFWDNLNGIGPSGKPDFGALAAGTARRSDGSLVPIYALGGRSQAGGFLTFPDRVPAGMTSTRSVSEATQQVILDMLMGSWGRFIGTPRLWGTPSVSSLDRVRRQRIVDFSNDLVADFARTIGGAFAENAFRRAVSIAGGAVKFIKSALPLPPTPDETPLYLEQRYKLSWSITSGPRVTGAGGPVADGETDGDGLVPVDSSLGFRMGGANTLPGGNWYRLVNGSWDPTNHGAITFWPQVGQELFSRIVSVAGPRTGTGPVSTF